MMLSGSIWSPKDRVVPLPNGLSMAYNMRKGSEKRRDCLCKISQVVVLKYFIFHRD